MPDSTTSNEEASSFLSGDSGMAALIRSFDWSHTLGPIEQWPASLKTTVGLLVLLHNGKLLLRASPPTETQPDGRDPPHTPDPGG